MSIEGEVEKPKLMFTSMDIGKPSDGDEGGGMDIPIVVA